MATIAAELSEAWTLRRRSATQATRTTPSYRLEIDLQGEFFDPETPHLVVQTDAPERRGHHGLPGDRQLTCRELQVIELVATGATDQEIANTLFISRRTVTSHMASILMKMGVGNRTAAAVVAARTGLIV